MQCRTCGSDTMNPWLVLSHGRAYCTETCYNGRSSVMLLYFVNDCKELRLSALEYFELAYFSMFGKAHPNVAVDYAEYLQNSTLPIYVQNFIKQKEQASCK